ncbi:MAG: hypothetical protein AAGA91_03250 [Pseudomonadota bacterium]
MSLRGACSCKNFEVRWHTVDFSISPRACQCDYCISKGLAYVSKSGTSVEVIVHDQRGHALVRHGSGRATFHECDYCGDTVLVTVNIDDDLYGALNANCLVNPHGFAAARPMQFEYQTLEQKLSRWQQNWCCPVKFSSTLK